MEKRHFNTLLCSALYMPLRYQPKPGWVKALIFIRVYDRLNFPKFIPKRKKKEKKESNTRQKFQLPRFPRQKPLDLLPHKQ